MRALRKCANSTGASLNYLSLSQFPNPLPTHIIINNQLHNVNCLLQIRVISTGRYDTSAKDFPLELPLEVIWTGPHKSFGLQCRSESICAHFSLGLSLFSFLSSVLLSLKHNKLCYIYNEVQIRTKQDPALPRPIRVYVCGGNDHGSGESTYFSSFFHPFSHSLCLSFIFTPPPPFSSAFFIQSPLQRKNIWKIGGRDSP